MFFIFSHVFGHYLFMENSWTFTCFPCFSQLPQQQNSYDCGLFLLHYVEQFLEEDPANISPFKITTLSVFVSWLLISVAHAVLPIIRIESCLTWTSSNFLVTHYCVFSVYYLFLLIFLLVYDLYVATNLISCF